MKLSQWAKKQGIHYNTAYRWFRNGVMPVKAYKTKTNTIIVEENALNEKNNNVFIYCRVSSYEKKNDLERQIQRCEEFCRARGYSVLKVYKEIASGMNDNRKVFWKMIDDERANIIVVENKDRLTRFGFNYIEKLLNKSGRDIIIINKEHEDETDLIKDMIAIITSFCCRLYGARRGTNKSNKVKQIINDTND